MSGYYLFSELIVPTVRDIDGRFHPVLFDSSNGRVGRERYFAQYNIPRQEDYTLVTIGRSASVRVVFLDFDRGNLVIAAKSRRQAYDIADSVRGYLCLIGRAGERVYNTFLLLETRRLPRSTWSEDQLLKALQEIEPQADHMELAALQSGHTLMGDDLIRLPRFIPFVHKTHPVREALRHLFESLTLFDGFVALHFLHDYREHSRRWDEKRYFENRLRYELAFVSAFRAVEAFFGVTDIKQNEVRSMLNAHPSTAIRSNTGYRLAIPIFGGRRVRTNYADVVGYFLKVRNAAAAHANRGAPPHLQATEKVLMQIQIFVRHLIADYSGLFRDSPA